MTPQQWLQSERDYETGRQLYQVLGDNAVLQRTFSSGPSKYNTEALVWEMQKLVKAGVALPVYEMPRLTMDILQQQRKALSDATFRAEVLNCPPEPSLPEANPLLEQLKAERPMLYDQRRFLHAQLAHMPTDAARLQAALQIQALSRQLTENWKQDAYVRQHGTLPAAPAAPAALDVNTGTLAELLSLRANLRSCISKWKKKPARAQDLAQAQADEQLLTARIGVLKGEEVRRG
jgi:hypothetical protein